MARTQQYWKLLALSLSLLTAAVAVAGWLAADALENDLLTAHADRLEHQARLLSGPVDHALVAIAADTTRAAESQLTRDLVAWSHQADAHLTVLNAAGGIIADSEMPAGLPTSAPGSGYRGDLPEIAQARSDGLGRSSRRRIGDTDDRQFLALRLDRGGQIAGYLRLDRPIDWIGQRMQTLWLELLGLWLLLATLAVLLGWRLRKRIEKPLQEIHAGVERFAHGEFQPPIELTDPAADGGLATTLNRMAAQLNDRINTVIRQRNEQEAILASMIEGVVAVDQSEQVITLNQVAARLFGGTVDHLRGRLFQEITRIPALQDFVRRTLSAETTQEGEFSRYEGGELRSLQAHGAALRDAAGQRLGAVIVFHDTTHLRRLEKLQREFVANVSHELKTPVTSIKGFIETLQDGAIADPAEARKFVDIIARQADRLGAIIEDLLMLSRIDQDADSATLDRHPADLRALVDAAAGHCTARAHAKQIELAVSGHPARSVAVNDRLLVQVFVNLIDNAVKYSDPARPIEITLSETAAPPLELAVAVRDHGCGISSEHLARLGERFYRVDTARSRTQGGTGLGLAIARQIVQAHGGRLTVESTPAEGSTFTVHLPTGETP